ncbi:DUF4321 domain-containing protein [Megasphaera cerevisiae]|jgi:membrane glycosyltransferase|uniref:DUF4321 domain-containing protein n=1 Tax=Megasphaera cerevisiae TaxID=39029 RepID=UPI000945DBB3|nr:DUF4321 domain-containing protein [Megasphaera cerevisiae]MCI1749975.1 DUF4321 domain-containing protein [Megasphaera cerevisiae]OKY54863.1 hypothetical protein BSR42_00745 [Megasphaera cerevisiae]
MRTVGTHGVLLFILFLVVGGILGGILGDILSGVSFGNLLPVFSQHYEIFNIQNVDLNLYIMEIKFGIRFAPNLLSIIGILIALFVFRHIG